MLIYWNLIASNDFCICGVALGEIKAIFLTYLSNQTLETMETLEKGVKNVPS